MYIYLNEALVERSKAMVSVFDHGFLYGDGIYETLRVYDGVVFMLPEHIGRLFRSADLIGLGLPWDKDALKSRIYETLSANKLKDAYVRLTISRGHGELGLDPELCASPTLVIMAGPFKEYPKSFYENGIAVAIPSIRRNLKEAIDPKIKSLNFLNNILAKIEAKKKGAYEAVMLNSSGFLTEGAVSNIFFVKHGLLYTPSVECGILDGITRTVVMGLARKDGVEIREGEFRKEDIYSASEVFLTNTTMEVMPVSAVDDKKYGAGKVTSLLHVAFKKEVMAYVSDIKAEGPSLWGYNE